MKAKLLLFFGLVVAAATLVASFDVATTHATGEKYIWTSDNTVVASGGQYKGNTTFTVTPVKRISGSSVELVTDNMNIDAMYGACDNAPGRIALSGGTTNGTLWIGDLATGTPTSCGTFPAREQNMDGNITVAAKATPPSNTNCDTITNADEKAKCSAVKSCSATFSKPVADCEAAWTTCIANHTTNGTITDANKKICVDAVTKGQLDVANKPPEADNKTTCAVVGIGWIICPVVTFLSQIVDASYGLVASFLTLQPLFTTGSTAGVYSAWSVMRNFANIGFVIAFLAIIFSQVTGVGLTNYGLKKMLPKLIVSAVLVNVSYWICAIAVDLSNILGQSIYEVLNNVKEGLAAPNAGDFGATGTGWTGIAGGILAGTLAVGALLYIGLSALLPALIAVLATIVTVLLVLVFRQALAIMLIVGSPIAFLCKLAPGTEPVYKYWKDLGEVVIIMFPGVGFIFGGSALASTIIMGAAAGPYKIAIQIMGASIAVLPLIVVPSFIKTAKGVLGKFGAIVDNPNKGPVSALKNKADNYKNYRGNVRKGNALSGNSRVFGGSKYKRAYRRELRDQAADNAAKSGQAQFGVTDPKAAASVASNLQSQAQINAINAANSTRFVSNVASNPGLVSSGMGNARNDEEVAKALAAQQQKAVADAIREVELSATFAPGDLQSIGNTLADAVTRGDSITARAMQNMLLNSGGPGSDQYRKTIESLPPTAMGSETMSDMKQNILTNHSSIKQTANDIMKHATTASGTTMTDVSNDAATWNNLSEEDLVGQKTHSLQKAKDAGGISKAKAKKIQSDQQLYRKLDDAGKKIIDDLAL